MRVGWVNEQKIAPQPKNPGDATVNSYVKDNSNKQVFSTDSNRVKKQLYTYNVWLTMI